MKIVYSLEIDVDSLMFIKLK